MRCASKRDRHRPQISQPRGIFVIAIECWLEIISQEKESSHSADSCEVLMRDRRWFSGVASSGQSDDHLSVFRSSWFYRVCNELVARVIGFKRFMFFMIRFLIWGVWRKLKEEEKKTESREFFFVKIIYIWYNVYNKKYFTNNETWRKKHEEKGAVYILSISNFVNPVSNNLQANIVSITSMYKIGIRKRISI